MKWLSYILPVYILLLALFPCCAVDDCPDEKPKAEQATGHQSGDEDDCGSCSPFFSCEGCATGSSTVEIISCNTIAFSPKQEYTGFISPAIPTIQYDFWQPPKQG